MRRKKAWQIGTKSFGVEDVRKIRRLLDKRGRKSSKKNNNKKSDRGGAININLKLQKEDVKGGANIYRKLRGRGCEKD